MSDQKLGTALGHVSGTVIASFGAQDAGEHKKAEAVVLTDRGVEIRLVGWNGDVEKVAKLWRGNRVEASGNIRDDDWKSGSGDDAVKNNKIILDVTGDAGTVSVVESGNVNAVEIDGVVAWVGEKTTAKIGDKDQSKIRLIVQAPHKNDAGEIKKPGVPVSVVGPSADQEFKVGDEVKVTGRISNTVKPGDESKKDRSFGEILVFMDDGTCEVAATAAAA